MLRPIVTQAFPPNVGFTREELLDEIRAGVTQMETPTDVDFVRIMSLHKSKGLTARLVAVMGCNEGMIPRIDYDEPVGIQKRQLEEQRRLFYVALTRTTETVVLSSIAHIPTALALKMGLGVEGGAASRFITELGPSSRSRSPDRSCFKIKNLRVSRPRDENLHPNLGPTWVQNRPNTR